MNLPVASSVSAAMPDDLLVQRPEMLANMRVILSHPSHPGNIGAAARAMKTMGLSRLTLVNPKQFPAPEAVARSAGAEDILAAAAIVSSLDEALSGVSFAVAVTARQRNLGPAPFSARQAAGELIERAALGEIALVFGNETAGLANDEVQRCQRSVFIPANPDYSSLNLGAAVQVIAYELRQAALADRLLTASVVQPFMSPAAQLNEIEGFYQHLQRVMVATGFLDPKVPKRLLPKLRRLFARAELERDEVNILRGILDSVEKNLRESE